MQHVGRVSRAAGVATALLVVAVRPAVSQPACVDGGAPFRSAIQAVHDEQSNIGYAAAVMLGGRLVESVVAGMADLEHQVPVHRASRFGVASITKAVTGTAVLALHRDGKLNLDAPVQRYVPEFPARSIGSTMVAPGLFDAPTLEMLYAPVPTDGPDSPWSFGWFARRGDDGRRGLSAFARRTRVVDC